MKKKVKMGSISKRVYEKTGTITYRVQLKRKGMGSLSITFDDYEAACDWLQANEKDFREDPEYYFEWRESLINEHRRDKIKVKNNIITPKMIGKK